MQVRYFLCVCYSIWYLGGDELASKLNAIQQNCVMDLPLANLPTNPHRNYCYSNFCPLNLLQSPKTPSTERFVFQARWTRVWSVKKHWQVTYRWSPAVRRKKLESEKDMRGRELITLYMIMDLSWQMVEFFWGNECSGICFLVFFFSKGMILFLKLLYSCTISLPDKSRTVSYKRKTKIIFLPFRRWLFYDGSWWWFYSQILPK